MTEQTLQQIITIHILPNISRIKGNQAEKFGQLIEHNVRNILLQKSPCASPSHFGYGFIFQEKHFFVMFYYLTKSHCLVTLTFSSSCFFALPKSQDKHLNISRTKRAFKMK